MKNIFTLLAFILSVSLSAQYFETSETQVTTGPKALQGKYIKLSTSSVVEKEGLAADLYQTTINWITENYKSPEDVIKGKIENEYVRISGSLDALVLTKVLGLATTYDGRYTMEFRFKDGRFKVDILSTEIYIPTGQYTSGWKDYTLNFKVANRKGKDTYGGVKSYERANSYFNEIVDDIVNYKKGTSNSSASDDDW
jgi:hypothetical protein